MKARILTGMLLGLCVILGGCHPKASTPTPRHDLQQADKSFEAGDYAKAAEAYEAYLRDNPTAKGQDRIFFRLALAYGYPSSPVHNSPQALRVLKQLVNLFPQSPYTPQAKVILGFHEEMEKLNLNIAQREDQMKLLNNDLEQLRKEVEKLRADVREREARLRLLNSELEKLKKIDMERRPSRPPN